MCAFLFMANVDSTEIFNNSKFSPIGTFHLLRKAHQFGKGRETKWTFIANSFQFRREKYPIVMTIEVIKEHFATFSTLPLSPYLSIYLSINTFLSIYLSIYLSQFQIIYRSISSQFVRIYQSANHLRLWISINYSISIDHLSLRKSIYLSICPVFFQYLSVIFVAIYLSIYLSRSVSIYLSIRRRLWWCNGLQARLANLHEWVRVSLGAPFIWPCATSKQKA